MSCCCTQKRARSQSPSSSLRLIRAADATYGRTYSFLIRRVRLSLQEKNNALKCSIPDSMGANTAYPKSFPKIRGDFRIAHSAKCALCSVSLSSAPPGHPTCKHQNERRQGQAALSHALSPWQQQQKQKSLCLPNTTTWANSCLLV